MRSKNGRRPSKGYIFSSSEVLIGAKNVLAVLHVANSGGYYTWYPQEPGGTLHDMDTQITVVGDGKVDFHGATSPQLGMVGSRKHGHLMPVTEACSIYVLLMDTKHILLPVCKSELYCYAERGIL